MAKAESAALQLRSYCHVCGQLIRVKTNGTYYCHYPPLGASTPTLIPGGWCSGSDEFAADAYIKVTP